MSRRISEKTRGERGQVLVEFTLVVVVFLLFIFGILDCARHFQSWSAVQHSAREGARYGITGRTTCTFGVTTYSTRTECIERSAKNATTGMLNGGVNGSGVAVACQSWTYISGYANASGSGACQGTTAGSAGYIGGQCDAEEVKVTYSHKFITPLLQFAAPSGIDLVGRQRMINEPFGPC
jgi:Flp pilus assembly protein TadG